jgi:hypothetical protein
MLFTPKTPLFDGRFALLGMCFMALKGFNYTITVDMYA